MTFRLITREQWGAKPPRGSLVRMAVPSPRVWLHHSAAEQHGAIGVRDIQTFHMGTRGYSDIAYSFLVDDDGIAYVGRGAGIVGAHTQSDNSKSQGICAMGNFDQRTPPSSLLVGIARLVAFGHAQGWWPDHITGGHRDAPGASTACPGRFLQQVLPTIHGLIRDEINPTPEEAMANYPQIIGCKLVPGGTRTANGRWPFWGYSADGGIFAFNGAPTLKSLPGLGIKVESIKDAAPIPYGTGLVLMADDGATYELDTA